MPEGVSWKIQKQMEAVMILSDNDIDFPCQSEKVWERMKYQPFLNFICFFKILMLEKHIKSSINFLNSNP